MKCCRRKAKNAETMASPYRCQLVEAGEEFVEGHHQLLRGALGRQAGEALDVGEQDAAKNTREDTREDFRSLFAGSQKFLSCLNYTRHKI